MLLTGGDGAQGPGAPTPALLRSGGLLPLARSVQALRALYRVVHAEVWAPTLATFAVPSALPAGLAATPRGSQHARVRRPGRGRAGHPSRRHRA